MSAVRARLRPPVPHRRPQAPTVLLLGGMALVALFAAITALQVEAIVLDETVYKLAAAQYVDQPGALITDRISRGAARLYALLLAFPVALFDGDVAVRVGRASGGVLFAGAAVPVFLLARRVARPGLAAAAGVLAVAVPWLTLSTILFSEALAYVLFAWALWAMVRALEAPGLRSDLLVVAAIVALITTRMQFVVLAVAWLVVVALDELPRRRSGGGVRGFARRRPVVAAGLVAGVLGVLVLAAANQLDPLLRRVTGPYFALTERTALPGDFGLATLFELEMLALGVGVVPAVLAAVWLFRALTGREDGASRRIAVVAVAALATLFAATLFAQGGWLDTRSEERYFVYAVPVLWIGTAGALRIPGLPAGALAGGAAVLAAVCALVPITIGAGAEQAFLAPVALTARHITGTLAQAFADATGLQGLVSARDVLAVLALAVGLAAAALWRRGRRLWALAPAVAVQLVLVVAAFMALHGGLEGVQGVTDAPGTFAQRGWIDRATPGSPGVAALDDPAGREDARHLDQAFWNDELLRVVRLEGRRPNAAVYPISQFVATETEVRPDLTLTTPPPKPYVVSGTAAVHVQLDGELVARAPDGASVLRRVGSPARALWFAQGLDADAHVTKAVPVFVAGGHRVTVELAGQSVDSATTLRVRFGRQSASLDTGYQNQPEATLDLCGRSGVQRGVLEPVRTELMPDGRTTAGYLRGVRVTPCS